MDARSRGAADGGGLRRAAVIVATALVAVGWAVAAWKLWDTTVPAGLEPPRLDAGEEFDRTAMEAAEHYEALARVLTIASQVVLLAVLAIYARRGARAYLRHSAAGPIGSGFLLGMMGFALVWLAQLPFGLVGVWWARRHDVVEVGYLDYVLGEFFGLGAEFLFICVALLITMALARMLRSTWWIPGTAALVGLGLFFAYVGPYLVPDLHRADRQTTASARTLSMEIGLPSVPVRIEKVREFTSAPNAYAFGMGSTRRIVLWDTLAEEFPQEEVDAVVAHELGHHKHEHIAKGLGWFALAALPAAFAVALVTRRRGLADPRSVPKALFVVVAFSLLTGPLQAAASRRYEAEADWAALRVTNDPVAVERLHERFTDEGLADPDPPRWFHVLFDSHPSALERVEMSRAFAERGGG